MYYFVSVCVLKYNDLNGIFIGPHLHLGSATGVFQNEATIMSNIIKVHILLLIVDMWCLQLDNERPLGVCTTNGVMAF